MKKFDVKVMYYASYTTTVKAEDEDDAIDIAIEEAENAKAKDFDWVIQGYDVDEP